MSDAPQTDCRPAQAARRTHVGLQAGLLAGLLGLVLIFAGCSSSVPPPSKPGYPRPYKVMGKWYHPLPHARGFKQRGLASWYGKKFHGRRTSNGEVYDMYAMTAAHKTLPLGTYVRVRNLANNRTEVVRVNDRGPFVRGRIIDLSYTAASKLGIVGPGTARVEIEAIGVPAGTVTASGEQKFVPIDYYSGNFTFQVGAFRVRENAERLRRKLARSYKNAHIVPYFNGRETLYRVRVGRCSDLDVANQYEKHLIENGYPETFTVAE